MASARTISVLNTSIKEIRTLKRTRVARTMRLDTSDQRTFYINKTLSKLHRHPHDSSRIRISSRQHVVHLPPQALSTTTDNESIWKEPIPFITTLTVSLLSCPVVQAAEGVVYNPQDGSETLKSVAGVAYIILVIGYFVRLFKRRADKATSERISSLSLSTMQDGLTSGNEDDESEEDENESSTVVDNDEVTPVQCLIGVAQASVICYILYTLSINIDAFFDKQELPTQYTARNIAILIQTVVRGLSYLATFIFGANAVGLASLGVALAVAPDWVNSQGQSNAKKEERLPDVKVTDDIYALRRAFKEAEEMGKRAAQKKSSDEK